MSGYKKTLNTPSQRSYKDAANDMAFDDTSFHEYGNNNNNNNSRTSGRYNSVDGGWYQKYKKVKPSSSSSSNSPNSSGTGNNNHRYYHGHTIVIPNVHISKLTEKKITNETEFGGAIVEIADAIYKDMGDCQPEKAYQNALIKALQKRGCNVYDEVPIMVRYNGDVVSSRRADIIVKFDTVPTSIVIIEVKADAKWKVPFHYNQLLYYMESMKSDVGYLVNFSKEKTFPSSKTKCNIKDMRYPEERLIYDKEVDDITERVKGVGFGGLSGNVKKGTSNTNEYEDEMDRICSKIEIPESSSGSKYRASQSKTPPFNNEGVSIVRITQHSSTDSE